MAFGLKARHKTPIQQHGQHIAAVFALIRGHVTLPAMAETENLLDHVAIRIQRVLRREDGRARRQRLRAAKQRLLLRAHVKGVAQPIDAHGDDQPRARQALDRGDAARRRKARQRRARAVGQHAHARDAAQQQPIVIARVLGVGIGRGVQRGRDHVFGERVVAAGAAPMMHDGDARAAHALERGLRRAPRAATAARFFLHLKVGAAGAAVGAQVGADIVDGVRVSCQKRAVARAVPGETGPVLHRRDGHALVPDFKQRAIAVERRVDVAAPIVRDARLQHEVGVSAHDIGRIIGYAGEFARALADVRHAGAGEAVMGEQKGRGLVTGDLHGV